MDYDYSDLINNISKAVEGVVEFFRQLCEGIKPHLKRILELMELLDDYKPINKIKHKPVKEIKPNKVILLNKRFNMFYCRNNC